MPEAKTIPWEALKQELHATFAAVQKGRPCHEPQLLPENILDLVSQLPSGTVVEQSARLNIVQFPDSHAMELADEATCLRYPSTNYTALRMAVQWTTPHKLAVGWTTTRQSGTLLC